MWGHRTASGCLRPNIIFISVVSQSCSEASVFTQPGTPGDRICLQNTVVSWTERHQGRKPSAETTGSILLYCTGRALLSYVKQAGLRHIINTTEVRNGHRPRATVGHLIESDLPAASEHLFTNMIHSPRPHKVHNSPPGFTRRWRESRSPRQRRH